MPFVSQAQVAKFRQMVDSGEITQQTFDEYAAGTDFDKLPERKRTMSYKKAVIYAKKIRRGN